MSSSPSAHDRYGDTKPLTTEELTRLDDAAAVRSTRTAAAALTLTLTLVLALTLT